jgi:hypothetical protein
MRCATSTSTMTRTKRSEGSKISQPCAATERNAPFWLRESLRGLNLEGYFSTSNYFKPRFNAIRSLMMFDDPHCGDHVFRTENSTSKQTISDISDINSVSSYAQNIGEPDACRF